MSKKSTLNDDNLKFEKNFWGDCVNTFGEEQKHYVYAKHMNLKQLRNGWRVAAFDVEGKSVLDIGGGPCSMLLKCKNLKKGKVCDPIHYPEWTRQRYKIHNIDVECVFGEKINEKGWDEVWIYNCLQHVEDVEKIINNAKRSASLLRIFEWLDIPPHEGHPQMLTKEYLDSIIGLPGSNLVKLEENGCFGTAYCGVFNLKNS